MSKHVQMPLMTLWRKATLNPRVALICRRLLQERHLSREQVEDLQRKRLRRVCIAAYENHTFYRERFDRCGFNPYRLQSPQDLHNLPLLTKSEYRDFTNHLVDADPGRYRHWYHDSTSGSTGLAMSIHRTWDERAYMVAKWMRVLFLNGYRIWDRTFSIPSPRRMRRDSWLQKLGLFIRHTIPYTESADLLTKAYCNRRPTVFYANFSQLMMIALFAEQQGIRLPAPRLCLSAGEFLDDNHRAFLEKVFRPQSLLNVYGAVEFNNLAWQEKGEVFFRFSHTTNLLEILTEPQRPYSERCAITDFYIDSFPLIRYDLEDLIETGQLDNGETVIKKIHGRSNDWIILPDGSRLPYNLFYVTACEHPEIRQFRIVQDSRRHITCQITREPGTDVDRLAKILVEKFKRNIPADDLEYRFEWRDQLPPDPNGKLRMIISHVQQPPSGS